MKIKNFKKLAKNPLRQTALQIIESGLAAIDTKKIINSAVSLEKNQLRVKDHVFDLKKYRRIFVVGVGKCAIDAAAALEKILKSRLTGGIIIDIRPARNLKKIKSYLGFHPSPSEKNIDATQKLTGLLKSLGKTDLVICIVSGGGSTILCSPEDLTCVQEGAILQELTRAGADIKQINTVRKHISYARGGFLAKHAYPAKVVSLIFSDVVGDQLDFVASGPTFKDATTVSQAQKILSRYQILKKCNLLQCKLIETPKNNKYFKNVDNILIASNKLALMAMKNKAENLGFSGQIKNHKLTGEAREAGAKIISYLHSQSSARALLYGGETTVTIAGPAGIGGRNQELLLGAMPNLRSRELMLAVNTDGWDNCVFAGGICDILTKETATAKKLDAKKFLASHSTMKFFETTGDFLLTGRLGCNISDLVLALKK